MSRNCAKSSEMIFSSMKPFYEKVFLMMKAVPWRISRFVMFLEKEEWKARRTFAEVHRAIPITCLWLPVGVRAVINFGVCTPQWDVLSCLAEKLLQKSIALLGGGSTPHWVTTTVKTQSGTCSGPEVRDYWSGTEHRCEWSLSKIKNISNGDNLQNECCI